MRALRPLLVLGLLVAAPGTATALPKVVDQADAVEVYARDVYYIHGNTLRTPDETTDPAAHLFNVAGVALDVTWGEWSRATAQSEARVARTGRTVTTRARLTMSGLVPNGIYSVFWGTLGPDSEQPLCPRVERTLPLDSTTGHTKLAPNAFRADARGRADYTGAVDQDLFAASQVFFTVVWNFSGRTSYPFPNRGELLTQVPPSSECRSSFGEDAMRHLLVLQKW